MRVRAAPTLAAPARAAVERWRTDAAAMRFHLRRDDAGGKSGRLLLAVIGGTGTGKSTLVNRLLGQNISAASFRRTFTSGPVAGAPDPADVPTGGLGIEHVVADASELPARGRPGALVIATAHPAGIDRDSFPVLVD